MLARGHPRRQWQECPCALDSCHMSHRVVTLALESVVAFDMATPAQVFRGPYEFALAGVRRGPVATSTGFRVLADHGLEALALADTVIVPGYETSFWQGLASQWPTEEFTRSTRYPGGGDPDVAETLRARAWLAFFHHYNFRKVSSQIPAPAQAGVPTTLLGATARAAARLGAGGKLATAGAVSAVAAVQAEGILRAMLMSKLKRLACRWSPHRRAARVRP